MKSVKVLVVLLTYLSFSNAYAYVDLNLSYSYSKRVIDEVDSTQSQQDLGQAISLTSGASVNWAWYIWEYTALELNYSETTTNVIDNREIAVDENITILEVDSISETVVSGAGLRQSFANRNAAIVPSFAIGFAKMVTSGTTTYKVNSSGTISDVSIEQDTQEYNSGYVTLQLRFQITQLMGITLAAKSVVQDYDTSKLENNVTYSAGFSWIF